ncbi:MAG: hypothetical protein WCS17_01395 [Prevotella sp.]
MKPIINLYLDFEFTSLSPDAQPISLGIVSDEITNVLRLVPEELQYPNESWVDFQERTFNEKLGDEITQEGFKSFYAEFTDFDIKRCDDWVKENVVSKLGKYTGNSAYCRGDKKAIIDYLKEWLSQFSDYDIQIVVDCGTWDWYHFLQLVAEWDEKEDTKTDCPSCGYMGQRYGSKPCKYHAYKIGLPKLPTNISPVPLDLNDLIAHKKGISVREAFDLYREKLADELNGFEWWKASKKVIEGMCKHNALWDAKVIKAIYQKLT